MRLHEIDLIPGAGDSVERQAAILGRRFGAEIRNSVDLYQAFYSSIGIPKSTVDEIADSSFRALEDWYPQLGAETRALAETIDAEIVDLMAVIARTEILVADPTHERSECSTAVVAGPDQRLRSIQTWDWHDELVPDALIRSHRSDRDLKVVTFTEFGAPAKIGLNSAGLSLNFNILHHRSDHTKGGVPVHAIARRILDEATTVEEAISVASSAHPSASTALTVSDQLGSAAAIEVSPAGSSAVRSEPACSLLHTNHFIDLTLAGGENTTDISTTYVRLRHLESVVDYVGEAGSATSEMAARFAGGETGESDSPICMVPDTSLPSQDQWKTLLTVAMDPFSRTMTSFAGAPDRWNAGGVNSVQL
ncbi:C45 family autoproteolytic acyltransferase/hydolase [Brevibacterium sp. FAM 24638]|uniref:C45 family autoproteolytic acyltransferase/hydolase n=1 Tax=unclassified Brevibacterium TaxID=2614124 RepID=UPI003C7DAF48